MSTSPLHSLLFTGEDHRAFLHRMFSHDIQQLPDDCFRFAALCNNKGRVIANGLFLNEGERTRLVLPACQTAVVRETLQRFRLRDRVEMQADNAPWTLAWNQDRGTCGEGALASLRLQAGQDDDDAWMDAACQAGLALITAHDREKHVPQTLNMDLAEGIHFNKGCYPGQEVVARLHYLGKPKNRCMHFLARGEVAIGDSLILPDQPTESCGTCILAGKGGHLLCTIKTVMLQNDQTSGLVAGDSQLPLQAEGLPYALS